MTFDFVLTAFIWFLGIAFLLALVGLLEDAGKIGRLLSKIIMGILVIGYFGIQFYYVIFP